MFLDVAGNLGFELGHGFEDAAPDFSAGGGREEAFDGVQPRGRGRREVEGPARMIGEPLHDSGALVSGVVIENGVNDLACRHAAFDGKRMNS